MDVSMDLTPAQRRQLLISEARRWVGIQEVGGNNRGQLVDIFLKTSGMPSGNPWCMAFVEYCVTQVDRMAYLLNSTTTAAKMAKSARCMTVWEQSPLEVRDALPAPGSIVIWEKHGSTDGHTGVVIEADPSAGVFKTIEGNTSPIGATIEREGDGVYQKSHTMHPTGTMDLIGFIYPWGK